MPKSKNLLGANTAAERLIETLTEVNNLKETSKKDFYS